MKTNTTRHNFTYAILVMMACFVALGSTSCGKRKKKKKAEQTTEIKALNNSTEVTLPFESKEYRNDKDHFRAKQSGKSPDLSTAKKIALQNAKSEMAGNIQAVMKRVTDQYTNQRSVANKQEYENKFEELSREVVNMTLNDVSIAGEKVFKETDGSFTYWVVVEANKQTVLNGMQDKISHDAKLQVDYDKMKFEQIFNQEMNTLEKESH